MNTVLVIYKSKYGSTKKYAEWIAADLGADILELSKVPSRIPENYLSVVFCGGLYTGKINGIKHIVKKSGTLKNRKLVVCTCGLSDPDNPDNIKRIRDEVQSLFPEVTRVFNLPGAINHARLNFFDGLMMKIMGKLLKSKNPDTMDDGEKKLFALSVRDFDYINRDNIKPVVDFCKT